MSIRILILIFCFTLFIHILDIELSIQSIQSRFMSTIYRPRLLICADKGSFLHLTLIFFFVFKSFIYLKGMGQAEIVADLLHRVEHFPIHSIDMASLHRYPFSNSIKFI